MPDLPDIRIGQAFSSSTNTVSLSQKFPQIKSSMMALPETYWYNDLMKDGFGKFDSKNKDMQMMLEALKASGLDESKAKELIIYGVGCEGCDHNHLGAASQATKVSNLLDIPVVIMCQKIVCIISGSGWPFGIGTPVSGTCGLPRQCMIKIAYNVVQTVNIVKCVTKEPWICLVKVLALVLNLLQTFVVLLINVSQRVANQL